MLYRLCLWVRMWMSSASSGNCSASFLTVPLTKLSVVGVGFLAGQMHHGALDRYLSAQSKPELVI